MACLDTSVLVDLLRSNAERKRRALGKIEQLVGRGEAIVTTRFCLAEMYLGIELSADPISEQEKLRRVMDRIDAIFEFGDPAAREYGAAAAHLRRIGSPAGDMDVLIAATALAHGHFLVTRNPSHFADIPHLLVEAC
jgi:tRNA(fMet)-specific endonuclease VapC